MNSFCTECGYKLDDQYKFCPDCGSPVKTEIPKANLPEKSKFHKLIICYNCGEENELNEIHCSSCGVKLKGNIIEQEANKSETTKQSKDNKKLKTKKGRIKESVKPIGSKNLESKKILLVLLIVIVLISVLLIVTGVFDTGINQNTQQTINQQTGSGIDLSNVNTITELENKVKSNPGDKASTIRLANLLQDSGLYERAISHYKKYLELEPGDPNARVDLGICFYNLNDFQTAIKEMETALKYQPNHQLAHLNLGIVNLSAGNLDASKEWFTKAVEINPDTEAGKRAKELLQTH